MTSDPSEQPVIGLRIQRRDRRDVVILTAHGELDVGSAPELREALRQAIAERAGQRIVVDLEGVDFIDSAGLGVVVGAMAGSRSRAGVALVRSAFPSAGYPLVRRRRAPLAS